MNSIISVLIARAVHFIAKACACLSSLSENPLFSSVLTIHILFFLYFPPFLLKLVLSPVTIITILLLVALLRSGSPCQANKNPRPGPRTEQAATPVHTRFDPVLEIDFLAEPEFLLGPAWLIDYSFVEWDVKAPLEVIYEDYEGEEEDWDEDEDEDEPASSEDGPLRFGRLGKTSSLEVYCPETDLDTSSDGECGLVGETDWPEDSQPFKWEAEDKEGLIEIALDFGGWGSEKVCEDLQVEEDNMIEIDLSVGGD